MNFRFSRFRISRSCFCPVALICAAGLLSEADAQEVVISGPVHTTGVTLGIHEMDMRISSGSLFPGDGTWKFSGAAATSLRNDAGPDAAFPDVLLRNAQGLNLTGGDMFVRGDFNFSFGVLYTHAQKLIFGPESSASGARNFSYAEGNVVKEGGKDFVFPVGEGGIHVPLEIFDLSDEHSVYEASYHTEAHPDPDGPWFDGNNWPVSTCDYWSLNRVSGSGEADVRLSWGANPCNEVNDAQYMRVARYIAGEWELLPSEPDDPADETVATIGPTGMFGDFALASIGGGINVLPITLIEFSAANAGTAAVETFWRTASETNNDYFTVERSADASEWSDIGTVAGAGNSNTERVYRLTDPEPIPGRSYYRLRQTDFDGTTEVSDPVTVVTDGAEAGGLSLRYLHMEGGRLTFAYAAAEGPVSAEVFDLFGKKAGSIVVEGGAETARIPLRLPQGIYVLRISQGNHSASEKFFSDSR